MIELGKYNKLMVIQKEDFGYFLDGDEKNYDKILVPKKYVGEDVKLGDYLDVFVYFDSEDRIIATTEIPYAQVGEIGVFKVVAVNRFGAFVDWGLIKDLFIPFREQLNKLNEGEYCAAYVYVDEESQRIAASTKLNKYMTVEKPDFIEGEEVEAWFCEETEIGYKAIVEGKYWGLLYKNEVFKTLKLGDKMKVFVKKIREDQKIDLELQKGGFEKIDSLGEKILEMLKESNGFLPYNDKSASDEIYKVFEASKKTFKKSIGGLYKKKLIDIKPDGLHLI